MYKENGNPCQIVRIYDGLIIAKIDGNNDYDEYKQWLASGNTPEPAMTDEEIAEQSRAERLAEIDARLSEIDTLKVRPISELLLNPDSAYARDKLTALETEAEALRIERAGLI